MQAARVHSINTIDRHLVEVARTLRNDGNLLKYWVDNILEITPNILAFFERVVSLTKNDQKKATIL